MPLILPCLALLCLRLLTHLPHAGLEALVARERAERLADARSQVAYDAELAQLRLSKLQSYYTASLAVHHITLHALRSGGSVSTIRQAELPKELLVSGGSSGRVLCCCVAAM
jgi:hypothetical protein